MDRASRRRLVHVLGVVGMIGLAACAGPEPTPASDAGASSDTVAGRAAKGAGKTNAALNPATLPAGAIALQRVTIDDPGVIARGPALTALVPVGWQTRGGIQPAQGLCADPFVVAWTAASPDGRTTVEIFPTEIWAATNTGVRSDCPPGAFTNVRDYLVARARRMVPGGRILDYRSRPDLAKGAIEQTQRTQTLAAQMGLSMRAWAEGGELVFAYGQNGVDMRGMMAATAIFYGSSLPNPMGGPPLQSISGQTLGTFAASAPNDELNPDLIDAVRRSVTPNAQWLERLFAIQNQRGQAAVQGTRERATMIVAGGASATQSNIAAFEQMTQTAVANSHDSIAAQAAGGSGESFPGDRAGDRMQRESIEAIRGVETYRDPVDGRNVQLDATYDHAWRVNNQDAYILTKDPNFNPGLYGVEATQMGVVK
jgi:hypothetical protein